MRWSAPIYAGSCAYHLRKSGHQQDQSEHLLEDQIEHAQRHGGDHAQPSKTPIIAGQRPRTEFWNPTGDRYSFEPKMDGYRAIAFQGSEAASRCSPGSRSR